MKRIEWWGGVLLISAALIFHAAFPRFEWRPVADNGLAWVRVDRWTGRASWQNFHAGQDLPRVWSQSPTRAIPPATPMSPDDKTIRVPIDQLDPK